jgi:hypothetical protein
MKSLRLTHTGEEERHNSFITKEKEEECHKIRSIIKALHGSR